MFAVAAYLLLNCPINKKCESHFKQGWSFNRSHHGLHFFFFCSSDGVVNKKFQHVRCCQLWSCTWTMSCEVCGRFSRTTSEFLSRTSTPHDHKGSSGSASCVRPTVPKAHKAARHAWMCRAHALKAHLSELISLTYTIMPNNSRQQTCMSAK